MNDITIITLFTISPYTIIRILILALLDHSSFYCLTINTFIINILYLSYWTITSTLLVYFIVLKFTTNTILLRITIFTITRTSFYKIILYLHIMDIRYQHTQYGIYILYFQTILNYRYCNQYNYKVQMNYKKHMNNDIYYKLLIDQNILINICRISLIDLYFLHKSNIDSILNQSNLDNCNGILHNLKHTCTLEQFYYYILGSIHINLYLIIYSCLNHNSNIKSK